MNKICDLKLTCPSKPEIEFGIIGIEGERANGQATVTVNAGMHWTERLSEMEYIPVDTQFNLQGLYGDEEVIHGKVTSSSYSVRELPTFVILFEETNTAVESKADRILANTPINPEITDTTETTPEPKAVKKRGRKKVTAGTETETTTEAEANTEVNTEAEAVAEPNPTAKTLF
jgi:hypothetical protein